MAISSYSTDPNANTSVNGIFIGELCPAANLNDAERQIMADIAAMVAGGDGFPVASVSDLWAGILNTKIITPKTIDDAGVFTTLTDGATITPDHTLGRNFTVTLGGNRTLAPIANARPGGGTIEVIQDATGSRTLAVDNTKWVFPGRLSSIPLPTAANAVALISYVTRSSGLTYATVTRID